MVKLNFIKVALIIAIAGVASLSSYIFFVIAPRYTDFLVENTEEEAIRAGNYLNSILFAKSNIAINKKSISTIDESLITDAIDYLGIRKLRLFSAPGEILYSTDKKEVGRINKKDYFFQIVAYGKPYTKTVIKNSQTAEGIISNIDVVESYVPIMNNKQFLGAFEIYYDISKRKNKLNRIVSGIYWTVFPFSLMFLLLIIGVSRKASKNFAQLQKTESELQIAYENMEQKVSERTKELRQSNIELEKESEERRKYAAQMLLAANVFENTTEGIMITDKEGVIQRINKAFSDITGFTADETLGQTPRIIKSDRHDEDFYKHMWSCLEQDGIWKGEIWNRRKNGEIYPEWLSINTIKGAEGETINYVALFHDTSDTKYNEEKLQYQAHYDALTGLPNRDLFNDRLKMSLIHAQRNKLVLAIFFLDLDDFKNVNDSLGHYYGDLLLKQAGERLLQCCREEDTVARLGGDEFMIIVSNIKTNGAEVSILAERIVSSFKENFTLKDKNVHVNISIGISFYPNDGEDIETLVKNADLAMYRSKGLGKNQYTMFTNDLSLEAQRRISLSNDLRSAMQRDELMLFYQPKVNLQTGQISGMEALVRWNRGGKEIVSPCEFIPLAEVIGVIHPLGEWVLSSACEQAIEFIATSQRDLFMAVNLSVKQFRQDNLIDIIKQVLHKTGLSANLLTIEITEGIVIEDIDKTIRILKDLKELGINISIDDFGTGYSSLSYLKKLPLSELKIDKAFIDEVVKDTDSSVIVKTILSLAKNLRFKTVAEGVETQEQLQFLYDENCDEIQGYLFSKPVNASEMKKLLSENKQLSIEPLSAKLNQTPPA